MNNDRENAFGKKRLREQMVGQEVAEMVLQILKGAVVKTQAWKYSQEASYRFQKAAQIIDEEIEDREVRYCFDAASEQLAPEIHAEDLWAKAAEAGAQYYLQIISSHGHAYGHHDRTRDAFILAVEKAMAGRRER